MGGYGSGTRWTKKPVVEGKLTLDTADLKRLALLTPGGVSRGGTLEWRRPGRAEPDSSVGYVATVGAGTGTFRLTYTPKGGAEALDYPVRLVTTPCHLGGVRWWFVCPLATGGVACGRRVRKLYLRGSYFGCRHCHGLAYTSSQESDSRVYAALRGGLDFGRFGDVRRMSVAQLGFALKVLAFHRQRLDRLGRRLDRVGGRGRPPGSPAERRNPLPRSTPQETDP